jgi:hypothetical protein
MANIIFSFLYPNRKEDYEININYQNCKFVSSSHLEYNILSSTGLKSDIFNLSKFSSHIMKQSKENEYLLNSKKVSMCLDMNFASNNIKSSLDLNSITKQMLHSYHPNFYSTSVYLDKNLKNNIYRLTSFIKTPYHQYLIQDLAEGFVSKLNSK